MQIEKVIGCRSFVINLKDILQMLKGYFIIHSLIRNEKYVSFEKEETLDCDIRDLLNCLSIIYHTFDYFLMTFSNRSMIQK